MDWRKSGTLRSHVLFPLEFLPTSSVIGFIGTSGTSRSRRRLRTPYRNIGLVSSSFLTRNMPEHWVSSEIVYYPMGGTDWHAHLARAAVFIRPIVASLREKWPSRSGGSGNQ
jgi:hypothetical protein